MGGLGDDERLCSIREVRANEPSSQVEPEAKVEKEQRERLLRGETYRIRMRQIISPLVVITLALIWSKLCSLGVG